MHCLLVLSFVVWFMDCPSGKIGSNYPYATITGGQGAYLDAKGYVELFIDDGAGFRHDPHLQKRWEDKEDIK